MGDWSLQVLITKGWGRDNGSFAATPMTTLVLCGTEQGSTEKKNKIVKLQTKNCRNEKQKKHGTNLERERMTDSLIHIF